MRPLRPDELEADIGPPLAHPPALPPEPAHGDEEADGDETQQDDGHGARRPAVQAAATPHGRGRLAPAAPAREARRQAPDGHRDAHGLGRDPVDARRQRGRRRRRRLLRRPRSVRHGLAAVVRPGGRRHLHAHYAHAQDIDGDGGGGGGVVGRGPRRRCRHGRDAAVDRGVQARFPGEVVVVAYRFYFRTGPVGGIHGLSRTRRRARRGVPHGTAGIGRRGHEGVRRASSAPVVVVAQVVVGARRPRGERVTRYRCERDSMQSGAGVKAGGVVAAPVVMV
ncbi:hypothetical protein PG999_008440 [Apiospora kogelbergensis]|uniref:Uncharacterized protein n=1 Tax=Apiospora kogelbergensis TaxID=1337665 RepID=A0AAW0QSB9_9PEZI